MRRWGGGGTEAELVKDWHPDEDLDTTGECEHQLRSRVETRDTTVVAQLGWDCREQQEKLKWFVVVALGHRILVQKLRSPRGPRQHWRIKYSYESCVAEACDGK